MKAIDKTLQKHTSNESNKSDSAKSQSTQRFTTMVEKQQRDLRLQSMKNSGDSNEKVVGGNQQQLQIVNNHIVDDEIIDGDDADDLCRTMPPTILQTIQSTQSVNQNNNNNDDSLNLKQKD